MFFHCNGVIATEKRESSRIHRWRLAHQPQRDRDDRGGNYNVRTDRDVALVSVGVKL